MLQSFERATTPATGKARLRALRAAMAAAGLDGFLVPRSDAHGGETVPERDERLAWLTGFTGSAGFAAILRERAGIFVDGRYRLQVRDQVDPEAFEILSHPQDRLADFLAAGIGGGGRVGFDPWLHTAGEIARLAEALEPRRIALVRAANLVDAVWDDQPPPPLGPIVPHDTALAGRSAAEKRAEIAAGLRARGIAAMVLTLPDSIAWLLNIRGSDIRRTPVPLAFAVLSADARVELFVHPAKCDRALCDHLGPDVAILAPDAFGPALDALCGRVAIDKATAPVWVSDRVRASAKAELVWERDPCILPKACKTSAEIAGARAAHARDGAAMVEFLAWLDAAAPAGGLTEIDVVRKLEACRAATGRLRDLSFDTIAGAGPNGAIVHYRVTQDSNRPVAPGDLLLVDSGGQYVEGTTDITRTVAIGPVSEGARRPFTLVLKGMIAMSRLRWPPGLSGREIDAVARVALWEAGLDYDHGTGHGIGSYLGVHEGPQALSRRSGEPLLPGMLVSNEPGYYREGAFGIRIENVLVVSGPETPQGGDRAMLGFETLTLAPIDRRLIASALLSAAERDWLNTYHAQVEAALGRSVSPGARGWLAAACRPIGMRHGDD